MLGNRPTSYLVVVADVQQKGLVQAFLKNYQSK